MFEKFKLFLHSNSIFLASLIVVWLVVIGALLMVAQKAHASETFVGKPDECRSVAYTAYVMVFNRDHGLEWKDAKGAIQSGLAQAKSDPESYVRNDDDIASMMKLADLIWNDGGVTAENVTEGVYSACMIAGGTRPVNHNSMI